MFDKISLDDSHINLSDLAERVMLGPQREVLEMVQEFNDNFCADLKVTKTFRWSPGIYQKIREIYASQCLGWDVKTSKISTFFNKIDNGSWRLRRMREMLNSIDEKLYWLRQDNTSFQDNTDLVNEKFGFLLDKVNNSLNESFKDSRINVECFVDRNDYDNEFPIVYFDCIIPEGYDMRVYAHDTEGDVLLHTFPYPFEISLLFQIPLSGWINKLCSTDITRINSLGRMYNPRHRVASGQTYQYNQVAKFNSGDMTLSFPFISSHNQYRDNYGHVCLGNMETDFRASLLQCEFDAFAVHLKRWASTYIINVTNPMSHIGTFFHGKPKANQRLYDIIGTKDHYNCRYPSESNANLENPYCDTMECQFRAECDWYINNYDVEALYQKHAFIGLLSEIAQDNITALHLRVHNPEWYYRGVLHIKDVAPKLLSFMIFYKSTYDSLYQDELATIKIPIDILDEYWHMEDISTEEHGQACINYLFENLIQRIDEEGLTFKDLDVDFKALNKHFGWIEETVKVKGQMPLWIDVNQNMPVKHSDNWYEDTDGVWRKHQATQNS